MAEPLKIRTRLLLKEDESRTHTGTSSASGVALAATATALKKPKVTTTQTIKPIPKSTEKDLYKKAMDSYAKKLKFEKPLQAKMKSFFDQINADFKDYYLKTGIIPSISDYQKDLEKILNDHGVKVGNAFSNNIREELGKPPNNAAIQRKLEANIKGKSAQRSHLMSHTILDTTRDNMEAAVKNSFVALAKEDEAITDESVGLLASENLSSLFLGRSNIISITETQTAAETGKDLEFTTMDDFNVEYDGKPISEIIQQKMWVAVLDDHTREAHMEADGQVVNSDEAFDVDGESLMFPGDDSMGASAGNLINCLHPDTIVYDALPLHLSRRIYKGKMVTVKTSSGNEITVTPNHPVLTNRGWILSNALKKGDCVVSRRNGQRMSLSKFDVQNEKSVIEQVFNSSFNSITGMRFSGITMNFHGEKIVNGDIDIVDSAILLQNAVESVTSHPFCKVFLPHADILPSFFCGNCSFDTSRQRLSVFSQSLVSLLCEFLAPVGISLSHSKKHTFRSISRFKACDFKSKRYSGSAIVKLFRNSFYGQSIQEQFNDSFRIDCFVETIRVFSAKISAFIDDFFGDDVVHVEEFDYSGYVYNIHDLKGYYNGNGVILHNCRCSAEPVIND